MAAIFTIVIVVLVGYIGWLVWELKKASVDNHRDEGCAALTLDDFCKEYKDKTNKKSEDNNEGESNKDERR